MREMCRMLRWLSPDSTIVVKIKIDDCEVGTPGRVSIYSLLRNDARAILKAGLGGSTR